MLSIEQANEDTEGIATAYINIGRAELTDGEYEKACKAFEASIVFFRRVGNSFCVALGGWWLGISSLFNGNHEFAAQSLEEAGENFQNMANDDWAANCLAWHSQVVLAQGYLEKAHTLNEEAWRIAVKVGDEALQIFVLYQRTRLARLRGDTVQARRWAESGLKYGEVAAFERMLVFWELGLLARQADEVEQARNSWREGFQTIVRWESWGWINFSLDGLAQLAALDGEVERAVRLFGTRLWRGVANTLSTKERAQREIILADLRKALGLERFEQLREEGRAMSFMQVLALMKDNDQAE